MQIMNDANGHTSFEIMLERKPEPEATTAAAATSATTTPTPKKSTVYRCTIAGREVFQSLPCPAPTKR